MGKTLIEQSHLQGIDGTARPLYKPAIPMGREGGPLAERQGGTSFWKADQTHF